jgi:hypothetical protein
MTDRREANIHVIAVAGFGRHKASRLPAPRFFLNVNDNKRMPSTYVRYSVAESPSPPRAYCCYLLALWTGVRSNCTRVDVVFVHQLETVPHAIALYAMGGTWASE